MRIVFFGSDDFAAVHLTRLLDSKHDVLACVTQPDRPKGRGMKVAESPIKAIAKAKQIPLLQPASLKDEALLTQLQEFNADIFVVVAYGKILPENVLSIPKIFCVNVHGSLLPKYRGAAPINWAIINGDIETGVTVMKMSQILDAGEIIRQAKMAIAPEDTAACLRERMAQLGAETLIEALDDIQAGSHRLLRQDLALVSYAPKLTKELSHISWTESALKIHNLVRGLQPWPGACTNIGLKTIKILQTRVSPGGQSAVPGTVMAVEKDGMTIAAGKQSLVVLKVQPESGKPMDARSFAAGYKLVAGSKLG
jgi:methionyl-tRNA formyltransferase